MRKQLAKATDHLKALAVDRDEAIHEARSRFKKARSVLRLLRGAIGEQVYQRENACYREAGRWLSGLRDATVVNQTLDNLSKCYPRQLAAVDLAEYRGVLQTSKALQRHGEERIVAEVIKRIEAAHRRVARWPCKHDALSASRQGLKDTYRNGRKRLAKAAATSTAKNYHEWRKQVGSLRDLVRLLEPVAPAALVKLAGQLKRLETCLSEHHDLSVLRHWFLIVAGPAKAKRQARPLLTLISKRQAQLETQAQLLGKRIYAAKPKVFADRLEKCWQV